MKITHTQGPHNRDAHNVEFHKIQDEDPNRQTDSPLIFFSQTTNSHFSPALRQVLAAGGPTLASIGAGMVMGFSATLLPELQRPESELKISQEVGSWIASSVLLPMSAGCLVGGWLTEQFGRKKAHLILSMPLLLGWLLIYYSQSIEVLMVGRVFGGLSVGLMGASCSVYLSEMSDPKYRGFFLGTSAMALSIGILIIHIVGTLLTWRQTALFACSCPILCFVLMSLVPETPSWLISKDRYSDGARAFKWLRGCSFEVQQEFRDMCDKRRYVKAAGEALPFWVQFRLNIQKPEFYKPFGIVFICFITMQFSGPNTVTFYSITFMRQTVGGGMNEYVAMILIDILRALMSIVACILLRLSPRRVLVMVSGIGTTVSLLSLAAQICLAKIFPEVAEFSWLSLLFLISYIFFVSIGIFPIPWCMSGELLPVAMRSFGSSINAMFNFLWCFIVIKTAPSMFETVGMDGTFLSYGLVCLTGTTLLYFFMPETKNKTLHEIEERFAKKTRKMDNI